MSTLCHICRAFPWHQFERERRFRYAWWTKESLIVPYDNDETREILSESNIVRRPAQTREVESMEEGEFVYYKEMKKIRASSANGCHICHLVWRGFLEYSMDDFRLSQEEDLLECFENDTSPVRIVHKPASGDLEFQFLSDNVHRTVTLGYSFVSNNPKEVNHAFRPKLGDSAGSSYTLDTIHYWFQKCERFHQECAQLNHVTPELPKRVIDVGLASTQCSPFLHISKGEKAKYVALSHRWGLGKICRTLKESVEQYKHGLPIDEMSNVFHDAIEVTRKLGIQYLWIDSLCIIQDSLEDWEIESGKMAGIYSNASFTIAAALSGNFDTGLFSPRDPLLSRPCRVNVKSPGESTVEIIRIWRKTDLMGLNLAYLYPLYSRANYTEGEPLRQREWKDAPLKFSLHPPPESSNSSDQAAVSDKWLDLVETYSGREMTFDTDWLPAMSGIAKAMLKQLRCDYNEYLAGLWRRDMLRGLTWYPNTARARGKKHSRPSTYVAPSWSWAAINGPVSIPLRRDGWRFEFSLSSMEQWPAVDGEAPSAVVLDARSVVRGLDPTGWVSSGKIVLFGPVCENPFHCLPTKPSPQATSDLIWVRRDDPDDKGLGETKAFALDVPGETLAVHSILLRLYSAFALILERNVYPGGNMLHKRIGWCTVDSGRTGGTHSLVSPDLFTREEVVVII